jgi:hypothetical protein
VKRRMPYGDYLGQARLRQHRLSDNLAAARGQ